MTATVARELRPGASSRLIAARAVVTACVVVVTVITTETEDWRPLSLVLVLGAALVAADVATVQTRRVRLSAGLTIQTTMTAVLGAGPAVAAAVVATVVESRVHRVRAAAMWTNFAVFSLLGLVGGVLFDLLRTSTGLEREDPAYAVLVLPIYGLLAALNITILAATHVDLEPGSRLRVLRESGLPFVPVELANGLLAVVAVFVWAQAGLAAVATLLLVLAITIPLGRIVADALHSGDDLVVLRQVSDERAAEVARLASDRERLLSEVLDAERRERARLAETLHDGPMQRLMALRQDAAEMDSAAPVGLTDRLDKAIAETRSLISAFHPATVRELGFAASLRSAVEPFPSAASIRLTIDCSVDDRALADTFLAPIAQELVVNAVKHADPSAIDVLVQEQDGHLVVEVNDDGVGIDTAEADRAVQAGHVGLAMVRRRVEDAGGRLDIATRSDGGTRSRVVLAASVAFPARS
jgi:signal transduction histidine kinase